MTPHSNLRGIIAMVLVMGMFIAGDSTWKIALAIAVMTLIILAGLLVIQMDGRHEQVSNLRP